MPQRQYCCCAIPISNAGVYTVLAEQLVVGVVLGAVSVSTPSIVGAATPGFAPWVFGIVCFVAAGLQVLGIIGVAKEKSILFRRYMSIHLIVTLAAFSLGATWAVISATRHSTAVDKCVKDFYDVTDPAQKAESEILCEIFPWVDVGIMGGVWLLLAIVHIYFYIVLSSYSNGQQVDRAKYDALNDFVNPTDSIPLNNRAAWNDQPTEQDIRPDYGHTHKESYASMSDVINQPVYQAQDGYDYRNYNDDYSQPGYGGPFPPTQAHTLDPGPTPKFSDDYYSGSSSLEKPGHVQSHPAEGSFGRKTPGRI